MSYNLQHLIPFPKYSTKFGLPVLRHISTNKKISIPQTFSPIYIGRSNPKFKVDIDLKHFHHSDLVSRRHARLKYILGAWYIEDLNSMNGTYINHRCLHPGKLYHLEPGASVAFGDKHYMMFIFEIPQPSKSKPSQVPLPGQSVPPQVPPPWHPSYPNPWHPDHPMNQNNNPFGGPFGS